MPLTDQAIKRAKPGTRPIKLSDEKGLYLLVTVNGSKLWRWKYRVDGKEKVMALGSYDDVSLAEARDLMIEARKVLRAGTDPMAERKATKLAKQVAADNSFQSVSMLWWDALPRHLLSTSSNQRASRPRGADQHPLDQCADRVG